MKEEMGIEIKPENFSKIINELNNMYIIPVTENIDNKRFLGFINGMSRTEDGSYICNSKGNIYRVEGKVIDDFSCKRAIVNCGNYYTYIDEQGKSINIKATGAKRFVNNLAPVRLRNANFMYDEKHWYIDLEGNIVSPQAYLKASPFKDGIAIVLTLDNIWQYIDDEFHVLETATFGRKSKKDAQKIKKAYNEMHENPKALVNSPLEIIYHTEEGFYISIMDNQTGLNPEVDIFVNEIAQKYNICLRGKNSKEKLLSLINGLNQIGDFILPYGVLDIIPIYKKVEINKSRIRVLPGGQNV